MDPSLLEQISSLHKATDGALALISGRLISDLQKHLGISQIPLAGLHGLERRDSLGHHWIHRSPSAEMTKLKISLSEVMSKHPGLLLEDKGLTLAVHYRMAPGLASYIHQIMRKLIAPFGSEFELQRGKRVVEIKLSGCNKASAVADYMKESPFKDRRPVFIGDDLNDEHGFKFVNSMQGISVKVGAGSSCACFRLPDVTAVRQWLSQAN